MTVEDDFIERLGKRVDFLENRIVEPCQLALVRMERMIERIDELEEAFLELEDKLHRKQK